MSVPEAPAPAPLNATGYASVAGADSQAPRLRRWGWAAAACALLLAGTAAASCLRTPAGHLRLGGAAVTSLVAEETNNKWPRGAKCQQEPQSYGAQEPGVGYAFESNHGETIDLVTEPETCKLNCVENQKYLNGRRACQAWVWVANIQVEYSGGPISRCWLFREKPCGKMHQNGVTSGVLLQQDIA
mmetsp:Transcript_46288/g.140445  ORF Transcript_46288/g.140445 Transcript_46288/m.140445 type:complete len:186 (+) Transcript_46288:90-647(+)